MGRVAAALLNAAGGVRNDSRNPDPSILDPYREDRDGGPTVQKKICRSLTFICCCGFQEGPRSNACETMRVPGFSSFISFGARREFTVGDR